MTCWGLLAAVVPQGEDWVPKPRGSECPERDAPSLHPAQSRKSLACQRLLPGMLSPIANQGCSDKEAMGSGREDRKAPAALPAPPALICVYPAISPKLSKVKVPCLPEPVGESSQCRERPMSWRRLPAPPYAHHIPLLSASPWHSGTLPGMPIRNQCSELLTAARGEVPSLLHDCC